MVDYLQRRSHRVIERHHTDDGGAQIAALIILGSPPRIECLVVLPGYVRSVDVSVSVTE